MRPSHKPIITRCAGPGLPLAIVTALAGVQVSFVSPACSAENQSSTSGTQTEVPLADAGSSNTGSSNAASTSTNGAASAAVNAPAGPEPPVERILLKPGKSLSISMATEDIVCTNDVDLARRQRESYPDSPEASFIYAVALSRTSRVEDALKEVRRARRLAEKQGGPSYFDKMIDTYEKMLTYYPDDNQVRYHLAWAYYMKAYVLAKYSHLANTPQAKYKEWVAQASKPATTEVNETNSKAGDISGPAGQTGAPNNQSNASGAIAHQSDASGAGPSKPDDGKDVLQNIQKASNTISSASPQAIPQVQKYYGLATAKLDDLLSRDPTDVWARVYRAYLRAESSGDLVTAMSEWQKVKDQQPLNPAAYFFLGQGYLKQGNLKECLSNVSRAVALRAVGN